MTKVTKDSYFDKQIMIFDFSYSVNLIFIFLLIYVLYKLTNRRVSLEEQFGFQGPKPLPLLGNIPDFFKYGFHACDAKNLRKYGHIYPIYFGRLEMLVVSDPDMLKQMLVKDAKSFIDRPTFVITSKVARKSLPQLSGNDWERVRALLTPTFTSGKLKKMCPLIAEGVDDMIRKFDAVSGNDIDVKEIFGSLTMDVIARTMFGIDIGKSKASSNNFVEHAKKLFNAGFAKYVLVISSLFPELKKFCEYLYPQGFAAPDSMGFFEKSIALTIKSRRNCEEEFHDFLSLMLKAHHELENQELSSETEAISYKGLTEEEIVAQSVIFMLAGYETTASALRFCTYYLAKNLEIQDEVYKELSDNLSKEKKITYDVLSNLNLLEQSINETLRICPPAPRLSRICTKDTTLTSSTGEVFQVKKGTMFVIPVYAIHHDERIWPDPDKFDIHRFDAESKQDRNSFSFMPFGSGPRVCIGQRFALLEAKFALAHLLMNYKVLPCEKTPKTLTFGSSGLTTVKEPVILRVEKR